MRKLDQNKIWNYETNKLINQHLEKFLDVLKYVKRYLWLNRRKVCKLEIRK